MVCYTFFIILPKNTINTINMKKILVPTDFSSNAESALNFAAHIAGKLPGEVHLLHTYQLNKSALVMRDLESIMREEAEEKMEAALDKYKERMEQSGRLFGQVVMGGTVPMVSRWDEKKGADLIVMGTQGATDAIEVFVGSVTGAVLKHSQKPVLAIPSGFNYRPFKKIVLALDNLPLPPAPTFEILKEIASNFEAKVIIFHLKTEENKGVDQKIRDYLEGVDLSIHQMVDGKSEIHKKVNEFVKEKEADMLCMVRRKKGFLKSLFEGSATTKQVYNSPVPLLVLMDKKG